jgi:predicted small metal-binding protein
LRPANFVHLLRPYRFCLARILRLLQRATEVVRRVCFHATPIPLAILNKAASHTIAATLRRPASGCNEVLWADSESPQPSLEEIIMTRKFIDCREFPSDMHCSVAISADSEDELLQVAVEHAVSVHGHHDTPELRTQLRQLFRNGMPPEHSPVQGQPASARAADARPH